MKHLKKSIYVYRYIQYIKDFILSYFFTLVFANKHHNKPLLAKSKIK